MDSALSNPKIDFLRMALILFVITSLVAALLGLANYFTAPIIAVSAQERLNQSLQSLVKEADSFPTVDDFESEVTVNGTTVPVEAIYQALDKNGEFKGYCVQVRPMGYSDVIDMIVALNTEGVVSGVQILSISDTPGIGMKVESDESFKTSVYGLDSIAKIVKSESKGNEVQVISGASISSSAYINGVNAALAVAKPLDWEVQS